MKIALCLSGQPRGLPESLSHLRAGLDIDNMDIFFHAWYDPNDNGKPYSSAQSSQNGKVGVVHPNTQELLLSLNPKLYVIEPQRTFEFTKDFSSRPEADQNQMASIFYTMYISNLLKSKWELIHDFKYDMVIRTRYDLIYDKPIDVMEYADIIKTHIVVSNKFQAERNSPTFPHGWYTLTDKFAIGSSLNMDIFSSVYKYMPYIYSNIQIPYGENYLGYRVKAMANIQIYCAPFEFDLLHRKEYR